MTLWIEIHGYLLQLVDCEGADVAEHLVEGIIEQIGGLDLLLSALVADLHLGLQELECPQTAPAGVTHFVGKHVQKTHQLYSIFNNQINSGVV